MAFAGLGWRSGMCGVKMGDVGPTHIQSAMGRADTRSIGSCSKPIHPSKQTCTSPHLPQKCKPCASCLLTELETGTAPVNQALPPATPPSPSLPCYLFREDGALIVAKICKYNLDDDRHCGAKLLGADVAFRAVASNIDGQGRMVGSPGSDQT